MAIIKKTDINKCWRGQRKTTAATLKNRLEVSLKIKHPTTLDFYFLPTPGKWKHMSTHRLQNATINVYSGIFHDGQKWKFSNDRELVSDKYVVSLYVRILFCSKKKQTT